MKTAKANRDEVREVTVTFPTTANEKKEIQRVADEKGITMSALCRTVLKDFMKSANN
jgi:antitoxin component of RelBE/YafQ-DinJ toxin-antitoxin module